MLDEGFGGALEAGFGAALGSSPARPSGERATDVPRGLGAPAPGLAVFIALGADGDDCGARPDTASSDVSDFAL